MSFMQVDMYRSPKSTPFVSAGQQMAAEWFFVKGLQFEYGRFGPKNTPVAIVCYQVAAALGLVRAHVRMGYLYHDGDGIAVNRKEAVHHFTVAAEFGETDAQVQLFSMFSDEKELQDVQKTGYLWLRTAMNRCDSLAYFLAASVFQSVGMFEKALSNKEKAAFLGDPIAQKKLADSWVVSSDENERKKAVELYRRACRKGSYRAAIALSYCYGRGIGVLQNSDKAVKICENLARRGFGDALFRLGMLYEEGDIVRQDASKSLSFYRRAVSAGSGEAADALGEIYFRDGERFFVQPDVKQAVYWFSKAVDLGYIVSCQSLAEIYSKGDAVPQDMRKAFEMATKARCIPDVNCVAYEQADLEPFVFDGADPFDDEEEGHVSEAEDA